MLLPWLSEQFEFKYKPIVLVRHPFAMVSSMMKHSGWNYEFSKFKIPDSPHIGFYEKHTHFLSSLESKEEQLVALWCMGNNHVLNHPKNNINWISVNYENLILEPENQFDTLFKTWGIAMPDDFMIRLKNPSSTTVRKKSIEPIAQLENFKTTLSINMLNRLKAVLNYFEVDYYNEGVMPTIPASKIHLHSSA